VKHRVTIVGALIGVLLGNNFARVRDLQAQISTSKGGLTRLLEAQLARFPAKAGVYVKHIKTGEEAGVLADEQFSTRSVIKIPIMVLSFQLVEQGRLRLDNRVEVRKEDMRSGSGVLSSHDPGLNPTIRDVITEMVITSDNTATDIMIQQVGGVNRVNEWIRAHGFTQTELIQDIRAVFQKRDLLAQKKPDPSREEMIEREHDRNNWLGVTTPREMGKLLEGIENSSIASRESCDQMKASCSGSTKVYEGSLTSWMFRWPTKPVTDHPRTPTMSASFTPNRVPSSFPSSPPITAGHLRNWKIGLGRRHA